MRTASLRTWYSQMVLAFAQTSGSFCLIHNDFGTIHSAETGPAPALFTCRQQVTRVNLNAQAQCKGASCQSHLECLISTLRNL